MLAVEELSRVDPSIGVLVDVQNTLVINAILRWGSPDLKARYTLELTIPADWQSVANGAETSREASGNRVRIQYAETQPISAYLFAFAAGKFQLETAERNGRIYRLFHRETDAKKVARNRDVVFDLHASSLEWLEKYTAIPYPFGKFDFVAIPSFQFGGMEHPGAIFYNASSILLDESATENQMLNRASTIAHETSHMWFGDLVTMRWFNDVWMKEVFANFMAAKIVNPSFPRVNHELRFLIAHQPAAYEVDRTAGRRCGCRRPIRRDRLACQNGGIEIGKHLLFAALDDCKPVAIYLRPGNAPPLFFGHMNGLGIVVPVENIVL